MIKRPAKEKPRAKPAVKEIFNPAPSPAPKNSGHKWQILIVAAAILIVAAGFGLAKSRMKKGPAAITGEKAGEKLFSFDLGKPVFAEYEEIKGLVTPKVPEEKASLKELENYKSFKENAKINFTQEQLSALEVNNFFLAKNDIVGEEPAQDDFTDTYNYIQGPSSMYERQPENSVFVSSDLALHVYHVLIDRSFQKIEEEKFQPAIRAITRNLFLDSLNGYANADDARLKESYKRLTAYYLAPLVVLDQGSKSANADINPKDFPTFAKYLEAVSEKEIANSEGNFQFTLASKAYDGVEIPEEIYNIAQKELALINEAKGLADSPLFTPYRPEFTNDYSQFKPRSHYTKNDVLKSYFIAMMWYGRMGFPIKSADMTRDALIITGQVNNLKVGDEKIAKLWSDISAAISFFVGEADDLTPYQYTQTIKGVYGAEMTVEQLKDDGLLAKFQEKAKKDLPAPKILSEAIMMSASDEKTKEELLKDTMQFRFMGQRFTPDAYIINRLTQGDEAPDPETGQKLPSTPTALMVVNLLASENKLVQTYLDEWVKDPKRIEREKGRESDKIIAKASGLLKDEFFKFDNETWNQNIYWGWLNCLKPLLEAYGAGYPAFMAGEPWMKKNLGAVLGSFTELKHDTLLYAKQSYAEMGAGGPEELPPVVKGYVEPDLVFWNRILALSKMTRGGLKKLNLMPAEFSERYDSYIEGAEFLRGIVAKELANGKISDDDFEKLRTVNSNYFESVTAPLPGQELTLREKRAGIIADIHTNAPLGEILYEATGKPYIMYVAVKDANGARLTRGTAFSHYEFTDKLESRLSDEEWQAKVYGGKEKLPAADKWTKDLVD
ncbi:MAG: DUF3160 domain-containing protein [Patescibacteria group bacterium]|jgi:hypothetical protein